MPAPRSSPRRPRKEAAPAAGTVELRLLGPVELSVAGAPIVLPRSKKCRALLGYLAMSDRAHRRDQLCDLFWDVADDPRGALRWTLSRLRSVLPSDGDLLEADRDAVRFRADAVYVDAHELGALRRAMLSELPTAKLEAAASLHRGELLEGLELPDFLDFTAWCIAERETLRRTHCAILRELVTRFPGAPGEALPWARALVQADAFDVGAHETLLRLLLAEGHTEEAERRFALVTRQFRLVRAPEAEALERAWAVLRANPVTPNRTAEVTPAVAPRPIQDDVARTPLAFVGREVPLARVRSTLDSAHQSGSACVVLVTAEPGGGKSRLLDRLRSEALERGFEVLSARAFDVERGRPFGPWIDALGVSSDELVAPAQSGGRASLFDKLASLVRKAATGKRGLVLCLDDVQWLDRDSAEVLQHVVQTHTDGALVALLAARGGELGDNPSVTRLVSTLQRDRMLEMVELEPFTAEEVAALVGDAAGDALERVVQASAGNPLYAIELARGAREGHTGPPRTLVQLLRGRLTRLSDAANDVLRWASVLGVAFDAERLDALSELPQLELVDALEELERHGLLRIDTDRRHERHAFSHDIVREAVYGELSYPRKRLMHRKVAHLLHERGTDPATAYEVARHASLAGEIELGVQACVTAGQYALRTCANADAEALARRGLHHAADLDEPARVAATLELLHVLYSARAPDRAEATERVRALAERALDLGLTKPARIAFQMLSYLRWESSSMADAHANILQAERVSRTADPEERSQALAYAARCLVLLERNLPQAEAFALEASGMAQRSGRSSAAVAFALGMIAAHRGETATAEAAFAESQSLARAAGERLAELNAIEHRLMLAIDRGALEDARPLAADLADLAARVRPGAEVAIAGALAALVRAVADGDDDAWAGAVAALRTADAKYELSFVLTRRAAHSLAEGDADRATALAEDGLAVARAIGRISDVVVATSILAMLERRAGDEGSVARRLEGIAHAAESDLSAIARRFLAQARTQ